MRWFALSLILTGMVSATMLGAAATDALADVSITDVLGIDVPEEITRGDAASHNWVLAIATLVMMLFSMLMLRTVAAQHRKITDLYDRLADQSAAHAVIASKSTEVISEHNRIMMHDHRIRAELIDVLRRIDPEAMRHIDDILRRQ